jgi:hypothetical protein
MGVCVRRKLKGARAGAHNFIQWYKFDTRVVLVTTTAFVKHMLKHMFIPLERIGSSSGRLSSQ